MKTYEIFSYTTGAAIAVIQADCWEDATAIRDHGFSRFYGVRRAARAI